MSAEDALPTHQGEKPTLTCVSLPGDHNDITLDPSSSPSRPATDTDSALCIACEVRCCQQHNNVSPSNSPVVAVPTPSRTPGQLTLSATASSNVSNRTPDHSSRARPAALAPAGRKNKGKKGRETNNTSSSVSISERHNSYRYSERTSNEPQGKQQQLESSSSSTQGDSSNLSSPTALRSRDQPAVELLTAVSSRPLSESVSLLALAQPNTSSPTPSDTESPAPAAVPESAVVSSLAVLHGRTGSNADSSHVGGLEQEIRQPSAVLTIMVKMITTGIGMRQMVSTTAQQM